MSNFKPYCLDTRSMDSMQKFMARSNARKKQEYGVHQPFMKHTPGMSTAGWYVHNKGNLKTAIYMHQEELTILRQLPKLNLP